MVGVDVGCNLEDKARKLLFFGSHLTLFGLGRTGVGGNLDKAVEKFLDTEVVEG